MTSHAHTGTVPQPPACPGARRSRNKLTAARTARRLAALAAPVPLLLACAAAASAVPAAPRPPAATRGGPAQAGNNNFSQAWYLVRPSATSVSARFTVPKLACPARGTLGIRPGVELSTSIGSHPTEAVVEVLCQKGNPVYLATAIVNDTEDGLPVTVKAGDTMAVSATETATASGASVADLTQRSSVAVQAGSGARHLEAFVGDDALVQAPGGRLLGVPPFGTITFHAAKVDGHALGASDPTAVNRVLLGILRIRTGPLSSAGTSFATTFKHT